ncbi:MAG: PD-(D/E)XK nuclease family protein, partial [Candidatus Poribacteria bacterium]
RLEAVVEELAQAQKRTEERLTRLESVVEELAQAQKRTEERLDSFERTFESKIGALGARWGLDTESAFRNGMRGILEELDFQIQRYLEFDKEGKVFDQPDQVELDVVIQDGTLILIEIKSSMSRADVTIFQRKIRFYEEQEGKTADRKLIIAPFIEPQAIDRAKNLGMEVFTNINSVR